MAARHVAIGQPVHEAEAHGIRILVSALPDSDVVYTNVELPTGRPGQTLEDDAVVIAPHGVYTVELKSWGGRIQGNRDRWTLADGTLAQSPIPLVNHKAKLLKTLLKAKRGDLDRDLHVQGLIFLSAGNATPTITPDYADFVVTRPDLRDPGRLFCGGQPPRPGAMCPGAASERNRQPPARWPAPSARAPRPRRRRPRGRPLTGRRDGRSGPGDRPGRVAPAAHQPVPARRTCPRGPPSALNPMPLSWYSHAADVHPGVGRRGGATFHGRTHSCIIQDRGVYSR